MIVVTVGRSGGRGQARGRGRFSKDLGVGVFGVELMVYSPTGKALVGLAVEWAFEIGDDDEDESSLTGYWDRPNLLSYLARTCDPGPRKCPGNNARAAVILEWGFCRRTGPVRRAPEGGRAPCPPTRREACPRRPLPGPAHRHQTLPCGFGNMRHGTDDLRDRCQGDLSEGCGVKAPGATGSISAGGRRHRIANVVHEGRAPTCRIRRGDPTERHGLVRPQGHTDVKALLDPGPPAAG